MRRMLLLIGFVGFSVLPVAAGPNIDHVFVIVMENMDATTAHKGDKSFIYGNKKHAPYINKELIPSASRALNFIDELPDLPSEPHYILMEAGTNEFDDTTFTCDAEPTRKCDGSDTQNWTNSPKHLATELKAAGRSWMTYSQGYDPENTGACPVTSHDRYAARHVPFVFFADVAGAPPAWNTPGCAQHFRDFSQLKEGLASGNVPNYAFIVPDVCNDMHGHETCKDNLVKKADDFLKSMLPGLIDWSKKNRGIVMLAWDEDSTSEVMPFILAGAGVKQNYASEEPYSHRSMIRTVERIFNLPGLDTVKDASDFSDMFEDGKFP